MSRRAGRARARVALAALAGAILAPPLAAAAQVPLGDSLWAQGRIAEAAAAYTKALETDRNSVRANVLVARTLAWAGKTDSALYHLRNARVRVPDDPDVRFAEALYLSWARRFDAALVRFDSVLAGDPGLDYVRVARARTLSWAGRLDEAERGYRDALARPPTDRDAKRDAEFGLAQVTAWRGDLGNASSRYDALLADDPGDGRALQGLASVRNWQGRPRAAIALLERAWQRDSTNGELRVLLASARSAAAPRADLALNWSEDSDANRNYWYSGSQGAYFTDRLRGTLTAGYLQADAPGRRATRLLGEGAIAANLDAWRLGGAIGVRSLGTDTAGAANRTAFTIRANASVRLPLGANAGVSVARYPFDEIAGLIAKTLDLTAWDLNGDITPMAGFTTGLSLGLVDFSDGNRRTSALLRASQRLPARFSVGAVARVMAFAQKQSGYFTPNTFSLFEVQGGWERENERWAGSIGGGYGVQRIDPAKPLQDQYHLEGRVAVRWKNGNMVALSGGISTSAASSVVGAFEYRTLTLGTTLVW